MKQFIKLLIVIVLYNVFTATNELGAHSLIGIDSRTTDDSELETSFWVDLKTGEKVDDFNREDAIIIEETIDEDCVFLDIQMNAVLLQQNMYFTGRYDFMKPYPGIYDFWDIGWPSVLEYGHAFEYRYVTDTTKCSIEILDMEYTEFKCELAPSIIKCGCGIPVSLEDITPYTGFKPLQIVVPEFWGYWDQTNRVQTYYVIVNCFLTQYDYENKIVRAYSHIRLKLNYGIPSVIDGTANDSAEAAPEYYNLQGVEIANPAPGTICIERRGTHARKIKL